MRREGEVLEKAREAGEKSGPVVVLLLYELYGDPPPSPGDSAYLDAKQLGECVDVVLEAREKGFVPLAAAELELKELRAAKKIVDRDGTKAIGAIPEGAMTLEELREVDRKRNRIKKGERRQGRRREKAARKLNRRPKRRKRK